MAHWYLDGCEITYGRGNVITDNDTAKNDDTDRYYDPSNDASRTSDTPPDTPDNNISDNESIFNLDDKNAAIIINPVGVDHHGLISGL